MRKSLWGPSCRKLQLECNQEFAYHVEADTFLGKSVQLYIQTVITRLYSNGR